MRDNILFPLVDVDLEWLRGTFMPRILFGLVLMLLCVGLLAPGSCLIFDLVDAWIMG